MHTFTQEITKLVTEAAKFYASKDFEASSDIYSEVNELYFALNEENHPDLLFLYGKSLFQLAVSKSDVFGGNGNDQESEEEPQETKGSGTFQFGTEEAFEQEEEPEDELPPQNDEEEDQNDFEAAWEVLDLARNLYEKEQDDDSKKKLSETYDLLGEVSLEAENFQQAAEDFEQCLKLRSELYKEDDNLVIESHYKLSLALEFTDRRQQAVKHLDKAIILLKSKSDTDQDLLKELENKKAELARDPLEQIKQQSMDMIKDILGGGESAPVAVQTQAVNDLTGMVKKRKPSKQEPSKEEPNKKVKK